MRAAEQTRVEYADGQLLVKGPKQRGFGLFGKPGSIDVTVGLPAGSQILGDASRGGRSTPRAGSVTAGSRPRPATSTSATPARSI